MTTKLKTSPVTIPSSVLRMAGISLGDRVKFKVKLGIITISAKPKKPEGEYTPTQRQTINARLKIAEKTKTYGPFSTNSAVDFLKKHLKNKK